MKGYVVIMYVLSICYDVSSKFLANGDAIQSSLLAMTNQKTVPNVFINQKHLGGCSDTEKAFADGTLAAMLEGQNYDYDVFVVGGGSGGLACSKVDKQLQSQIS